MLRRPKSQILKEIPLHQLKNLQSGFLKDIRAQGHHSPTAHSQWAVFQRVTNDCMAEQMTNDASFIINTSKKRNPSTITKPSHPHTVFIMGHLKKHAQTVCSVSQRSSLCSLLFYSLQGGLFQWRYQMITYSVFPRVDVVVEASMSHCGGAGFWHATKKGSCQSSTRF